MKFLLFVYCVFLISHLSAAEPIAEVIKIRGTVTQLPPTANVAKQVELGDKLVEDTSILTTAKSFVKIKFIDNSELNVGPESKIVISQMKQDSPGIISLLKGRIRTEVEKDVQQNENKLFIKTRSAAMGVRGTDFQTIYNPENKTTSLLTFKGEVAMAKISEDVGNKAESDVSVLQEKLGAKEAVLVPPGQSSFANETIAKTTMPVKISPVQLKALYKNQEFYTKEETPLLDKDTNSPKVEDLKVAPQKAPAEGFVNKATGDFAPKAGGFIDLETGIYVAPDKNAVLDKKNGVYVSRKIGNTDATTGEYVPPEGLVLDAKKGFVVDDNQGSKTKELTVLKNDLNKTVIAEVIAAPEVRVEEPAKKIVSEPSYNINEKFMKEHFSVAIKIQQQEITANKNEQNRPYYSVKNNDFVTLSLNTETASTNRYRMMLSFDYSQNKYPDGPGSLFALSGGIKYALSKKFDLFSTVGLFQEQFLAQTSDSSPMFAINRIVLTRVSLGVAAQFYKDQKYSLDTTFQLLSTFRKRLNGTVVQSGGGVSLALTPKMAVGVGKWLGGGLSVTSQNQSIDTTYGSNKQNRNSAGFELKFIWE